MAESSLEVYVPGKYRRRDAFLAYLADPTIKTVQEAGAKAGYSPSSVKSYVYTILRDSKNGAELERVKASRSDKARSLRQKGVDGLLTAVDRSSTLDPLAQANICTASVKVGLEIEEKHGASEEHSPGDRQAALRKGHLRLVYAVLRATACWSPSRVFRLVEAIRSELGLASEEELRAGDGEAT